MELTKEGKQEFALAIILWKDFKSEGRFDPKLTITAIRMAKMIGVEKEYDELMTKIPPMKITPREG